MYVCPIICHLVKLHSHSLRFCTSFWDFLELFVVYLDLRKEFD